MSKSDLPYQVCRRGRGFTVYFRGQKIRDFLTYEDAVQHAYKMNGGYFKNQTKRTQNDNCN